MINNIAVSVIIPLYNSKKYIKKCIESLLEQSLKNIEILIVDNNSIDGSGDLVDIFKENDDRIIVFHLKLNIGAGQARNFALCQAKGEYVAFLDSDDFYPSSQCLSLMYSKAKKEKANICGGSLFKVDKYDTKINTCIKNQYFTEEKWYNYSEYQFDGGFYRFIYNRKFLLDNRIFFPNRKKFEDPIFFVKSMIKAKRFYAISEWVYAYRIDHKIKIWDNQDIIDHLVGVQELLYFSSKNNLSYLHYLMVKNILFTLKKRIKNLKFIDKLYILYKIKNKIRWDLIKFENKKNKLKISFITIFKIFFLY